MPGIPPTIRPESSLMTGSPRLTVLLPASLAVIVCCAATMPTPPSGTYELPGSFLTTPVRRGTLEQILAEQGLVDSAENFVVTSECEWKKRIIRLVPEGEWVEAGDIVVELDASDLEERLDQREILIINAEASLINAEETLRLRELQNESRIAKAELAGMLARLDFEKYVEGEFPKQQMAAEAAVALAEVDVSRAAKRYEYIVRMARKGYETYTQVEKDRITLLKYEHKFNTARRALDVLVTYTHERQFTELQSVAAESKRELVRVRRQADLSLANQRLLVENRRRRLRQHTAYADRLRKSIAACTIRSPETGEIIYANEGSVRNEILEGETVRYRQEVVRIPDLDELQVKLRIHESQIAGIVEGLEATISVDAYPGLVFTGHVKSVSSVPTAGSRYSRDLKEYDAAIRIDATPEETKNLKPGLTAKVEIHISRRENCLSVPPQSVVNLFGHQMIFVSTADGIEHREIEIGLIADTGVEVVSGLQPGEEVLLSPRTTCSEQIVALTDAFSSETRARNIGG